MCLVLSSWCMFFGSAEHLYCFCALNSTDPTQLDFTRWCCPTLTYKEPLPEQQVDDPPCNVSSAWKQSYSTRSRVQDVRLQHRSRLQSLPAWSRHVQGITQYKMASNIQLTMGRDREIAGLILLFR